jgi:hypothetical protein
MSAGMDPKSGVDIYRSAVSVTMARMFVPLGASVAISRAVATIPPPDVPQKMPSFVANS